MHTPKDFRNFLYLVWKHLGLPPPTPIQYDIAHYLQHGPERTVISAFRGVGKSWITSAFVTWTLDHHPDWNVLVVSASKQRADDFSTFVQRLIREMPMLKHLAPRDGQRDSKVSFDVGPAPASHMPSVKSLGITSQLSGSRANLIVADDIEVPGNSQTQLMRDKLSELVKEFESIIKPPTPSGQRSRIVFLGTPQCEQSIYHKLEERGYQMKIWPARCPSEADMAFYGERLGPAVVAAIQERKLRPGAPVDPDRFDDIDLKKREASYGKAGFALQFMLNTNLSDLDRYPLKVRDLVVMDLDPVLGPEHVVWSSDPSLVINDLPNVALAGDYFHRPIAVRGSGDHGVARWVPYTGAVMAIDPSGRGKDELGYAIVKMLNGQLFVTACGGFLGGYQENNLLALASLAKDHGVNSVIVESNFGDGMFTALFKPILSSIHPCFVEEVRHSKQKELRIIDTLEPVMMRHKLIVDGSVIRQDYESAQRYGSDSAIQYQLIYQLTRITRDRGALSHDDRLDALAIAVAYWTSAMARDIERAKAEAREELMRQELDRFVTAARTSAIGEVAVSPLVWAKTRFTG